MKSLEIEIVFNKLVCDHKDAVSWSDYLRLKADSLPDFKVL